MRKSIYIILCFFVYNIFHLQSKNLSNVTQHTKNNEGLIIFGLEELNGVCTSQLSLYDSIVIYFKKSKALWECNRSIPMINPTDGSIISEQRETSFKLFTNTKYCSWKHPRYPYVKEPYHCDTPSPQTAKLIFTKETKMIAGFLCKKVLIQHKISDIKGQNSAIQWELNLAKTMPQLGGTNLKILPIPYQTALYYTDQLPKHISLFEYTNLNGCILEHTGVDGLHVIAKKIEFSAQKDTIFALPQK